MCAYVCRTTLVVIVNVLFINNFDPLPVDCDSDVVVSGCVVVFVVSLRQ